MLLAINCQMHVCDSNFLSENRCAILSSGMGNTGYRLYKDDKKWPPILPGSNDEIVSTNVASFYSETHAVNSFHVPDYPNHLSQ